MTLQESTATTNDEATVSAPAPLGDGLRQAVDAACRRIAPLWPVQHFVAVNPFLGLTDQPFGVAAHSMARCAGARMTMPRAFYLEAIDKGEIRDQDLATALERHPAARAMAPDSEALRAMLQDAPPAAGAPIPTATDAAGDATGVDWSDLAREQISVFAASHFDQGQALWLSPTRHHGPYVAWREHASVDRTPQVMGLPAFRRVVQALPQTASAMIAEGTARLGIGEHARVDYFHRLLASLDGWAGFARYKAWQSELRQRTDTTLAEMLAVRLAWDVAILESLRADPRVDEHWHRARQRLDMATGQDRGALLDQVLQSAYEAAWQRDLRARLGQSPGVPTAERKAVQAVFCIDVRSEVYRRALESVSPRIDTLGFAGFFGMPIEFVPLGRAHGDAQCPVLIAPGLRVRESVRKASADELDGIVGLRRLRQRAASALNWFKLAAVSSLAYVETMGWMYLGKLLTDAFGFSRPVPHPHTDGLDERVIPRLAPDIEPDDSEGDASGLALDTRVELAEGALKAMSLRDDFARLVVLAGHGAASINNPHASGLDCGACGGHSGEANARVAAAVLNDPRVRDALRVRGIDIPADTWFVAALHNTTTDQLDLFDLDDLPATHANDVARLQDWADAAGRLARLERAASLRLRRHRPVDAQIEARSRDWSQVRPEWGLAGCAAFIVAPRSRTAGLDLGGRAFLNSYDWRKDRDFAVLESIMTAPMIVASWINLQYYGSVVDNRAFGCGNKVLHNVVGKLGVLEGNGGNLRSGLPLQSLHDGERWVHQPLRLSVVINAPVEAINRIIARHAAVRDLVDNGWIHLFAMPDESSSLRRYGGDLAWEAPA